MKVSAVSQQQWSDVVDGNCQIVVCSGTKELGKPYALAVLHDEKLKRNGNSDGNLCGTVRGGVKPEPVWIADLGDYQVVTVFGSTQSAKGI